MDRRLSYRHEARGVSQPLALLPSQSLKPALQRMPHMLDVHEGVVFGGAGQTLPHAPQLAALDRASISQPLAALASQSKKPAAHTGRHALITHEATVPGRDVVQTALHAPQFIKLVRVSTSQPLALFPSQSAKPVAHSDTHAPVRHEATELGAAVQRVPHAPQLLASVASVASQPLVALESQLPKPDSQASEHIPMAQRAVALAPVAQRVPHAPQLVTSVAIASSQPLALLPSQLPKPAAQPSVHVPDVHCALALGALMQRVAHVPQNSGLRAVSASHPLDRSRSQSAKPEEH